MALLIKNLCQISKFVLKLKIMLVQISNNTSQYLGVYFSRYEEDLLQSFVDYSSDSQKQNE